MAAAVKLACSNIAWSLEEDPIAAGVLAAKGIAGVEIAPTVVWPDPTAVTHEEAIRYRDWWLARGITVVAFQSLLFGHPELVIFHDRSARVATLDYLAKIFRLAGWLGAKPLVFGSPKNRLGGHLTVDVRDRLAVEFFREAGRRAADENVTLCIEPNPTEYGCDYVTRAEEAARLADQVAHPGFGVHLDAAGLHLAGESVPEAVRHAGRWLRHFHASEPYLAPLGTGGVDHQIAATTLMAAGYQGVVSVEMRRQADLDRRVELERAADRLMGWYGAPTR